MEDQKPPDHTNPPPGNDPPPSDTTRGDIIPEKSESIFTHITALIAEDLKKSTPDQIATYPWNDLDNNDVDLAFQYLSTDPVNLQKILSSTSDEGIEKIQNSLSLQTFTKILQSIPEEEKLKFINKLK
jgi:Mg/Co/Ni transporter MgtE